MVEHILGTAEEEWVDRDRGYRGNVVDVEERSSRPVRVALVRDAVREVRGDRGVVAAEHPVEVLPDREQANVVTDVRQELWRRYVRRCRVQYQVLRRRRPTVPGQLECGHPARAGELLRQQPKHATRG